jgi:hypothetical protein
MSFHYHRTPGVVFVSLAILVSASALTLPLFIISSVLVFLGFFGTSAAPAQQVGTYTYMRYT